MNAVASTRRVRLRPLSIVADAREPGAFIVGRPEGGEFVELPDVGVRALRLLGEGLAIGEVEERLADGDELPDVDGLVDELVALGFVDSVDDRPLPDELAGARVQVSWLRPAHVGWLFSRPAAAGFAALLAAAAVTLTRQPDLLPRSSDFFWCSFVGVATFVNVLLFTASALLHELLHLAAARSVGVSARIGLGTRLHNLTLQTDVTAAWGAPRRHRHRIFLAGMAWDVTSICLAILVRAQLDPGTPLARLLAAYTLVALVGLVFQVQIFMRTDLYFVVLDALRCRDLFHDSLRYARWLGARATSRIGGRPAPTDPLATLPGREARAVRIYTPLLLLGSAAALTVFVLVAVPILVVTTVRSVGAIVAALAGGSVPHALDGGLVLVADWSFQLLFLVTFARTHPRFLRFPRRRPPRGGD